ncbi:hypothetical protein GCK72_003956 [Caenorhabditis remanei]|uniref:RING-type domain-containing protein n=1 Tax=Caenorhabditis remanei TaxID=31234 RepID=A0A6A5H839_CAERE|nr:hypothetical protein GCK72_003956 [Caenorhabditis remanei]KAF1764010.1 hypothetical protein GCK72_003956 [Caenorhabditis remanei]
MSKFFENVAPPYASLHTFASLQKYILNQNRQRLHSFATGYKFKTDGSSDVYTEEQTIQMFLEKSDHKLRMYGSPREFSEQLKIFRNFTGSHIYLDLKNYESYYTTPMMYHSLSGDEYICKSDLFAYLQNLSIRVHKDLNGDIFMQFLSIYLKAKEQEMCGMRVDFVAFDPKVFEEIEREFEESMQILIQSKRDESCGPSVVVSDYTPTEVFNKLKELVPVEWTQKEIDYVQLHLTSVTSIMTVDQIEVALDWLYFNIQRVIETYDQIMEKRPDMFYSSVTGDNTIRLFEDGSHSFVTVYETFTSVKAELHGGDERFSKIMDLEWASDFMKSFPNDIVFIRVPIRRAKHRAVPIRGPKPDEFSILAVDALFDLLKQMIFGVKLFQNGKCVEKNVAELFKRLERGFMLETNRPYLINLKHCDLVLESLTDQMTELSKKCNPAPLKDVRNAKKDGFTVENLRNELRHLNLLEMFPEILDYAGIVYEWVDKMKNEDVLRTSDLFDAVEMCQLICIFKNYPKLKAFLHTQKGCGRVLTLECDSCDGAQRTEASGIQNPKSAMKSASESPSLLNPPASSEASTPEVVESPEESKNSTSSISVDSESPGFLNPTSSASEVALKPKKNQKSSEVICEKNDTSEVLGILKETESVSANSESPVAEVDLKPKKNQKKALESAKNQKSSSEAPPLPAPKKESANCVKCYRTCEMLNETKKELKSTQNKLAMYEKKNLEMDKEKKKKNERILEEQEEKIAKLQKGLEAKDQEIVETKKRKEREMEQTIGEFERILEAERMKVVRKEAEHANERQKYMQSLEGKQKEMEEMKRKLASATKEFHQNQKTASQSFLNEKSAFQAQIAKLERDVISEKQQMQRVEQKLQETMRKLSDKKSGGFHVEIVRLKAENETKDRMIQQLMDRLANSVPIGTTTTTSGIQIQIQNPMPENVSTSSPYLQYPDTPAFEEPYLQYPEQHRWESYDYEMPYAEFQNPMTSSDAFQIPYMEQQPEIENLPTSSEFYAPEAYSEMVYYEAPASSGAEIPASEVSTPSDVSPESIPVVEVVKATKNPAPEYPDSECPICLVEMKRKNKKINCNQCKKQFHSHCASKWLKVKSECPACRGRLLDPNEFPSLS